MTTQFIDSDFVSETSDTLGWRFCALLAKGINTQNQFSFDTNAHDIKKMMVEQKDVVAELVQAFLLELSQLPADEVLSVEDRAEFLKNLIGHPESLSWSQEQVTFFNPWINDYNTQERVILDEWNLQLKALSGGTKKSKRGFSDIADEMVHQFQLGSDLAALETRARKKIKHIELAFDEKDLQNYCTQAFLEFTDKFNIGVPTKSKKPAP